MTTIPKKQAVQILDRFIFQIWSNLTSRRRIDGYKYTFNMGKHRDGGGERIHDRTFNKFLSFQKESIDEFYVVQEKTIDDSFWLLNSEMFGPVILNKQQLLR